MILSADSHVRRWLGLNSNNQTGSGLTLMQVPSKAFWMVAAGFAVSCGISEPAQAYVDPNAGGLLFQLLAPLLALGTALAAFARRQVLRLWDSLLLCAKVLATRLFRADRRRS